MFDESRFPVFAITDERENERKQEKESIRSDYRIFSQEVPFIYKYKCRDSHNEIPIYTQNKCTAASHSFLAPLFTFEIQVIEKIIPVILSARHLTVALEIVIRFIYTFHIVFTLIVLHLLLDLLSEGCATCFRIVGQLVLEGCPTCHGRLPDLFLKVAQLSTTELSNLPLTGCTTYRCRVTPAGRAPHGIC